MHPNLQSCVSIAISKQPSHVRGSAVNHADVMSAPATDQKMVYAQGVKAENELCRVDVLAGKVHGSTEQTRDRSGDRCDRRPLPAPLAHGQVVGPGHG